MNSDLSLTALIAATSYNLAMEGAMENSNTRMEATATVSGKSLPKIFRSCAISFAEILRFALTVHVLFAVSILELSASNQYPALKISPISAYILHPSVTTVLRDKQGRLWVGTQDGLFRYDGTTTEKYSSAKNKVNFLPDSHITDLAEDEFGAIYATFFSGGISRWNSSSNDFEALEVGKKGDNSAFVDIVEIENGQLLALTEQCIYRYDNSSGKSSISGDKNVCWKGLNDSISTAAVLYNGDIIVAGNAGLFIVSQNLEHVRKLEIGNDKSISLSKITVIRAYDSDSIFLGHENGLISRLKKTVAGDFYVSGQNNTQNGRINDILFSQKKLIVASDSGLFVGEGNSSYLKRIASQGSTRPAMPVDALFLDRDLVWVGTLDGLYTLTFSSFETIRPRDDDASNLVYAFENQSENIIWVGTYDGLYRYDTSRTTLKNASSMERFSGIESGVSSLEATSRGLWVGLFSGGIRIVEGSTVASVKGLTTQTVTSIAHSGERGETWVATYENGLYLVKESKVESLLEGGSFTEPSITLVSLTNFSKELFAVSFGKVYRYFGSGLKFQLLDFSFGKYAESPIVYSIKETSNGDIWIGTKSNGLFKWGADKRKIGDLRLVKVNPNSVNASSTIYGILEDSSRHIWASTQNGIQKLNAEGMALATYTSADGLQGDDFNLGAAHKGLDGRLYFGGSKGFSAFKSHSIGPPRAPSNVIITELQLSGSSNIVVSEMDTKLAVMSYRDRHAVIRFTSLDFLDPSKTRYRYKLSGLDDEWINSGTRNFSHYTNLPTGEYVFQVQASTHTGIWEENGASINLKVLSPPWLSWWAFALYSIGACMFIWALHRIYYSFAIARKANELAFEMHLAEERADDEMQEQVELQQDLVQSAYDHNKTTLALIAGFLEGSDSKQSAAERIRAARKHQTRITALSNLEECLYFQAGGSVVDLYKLTEMLFTQLLPLAQVEPATLITINEVTKQLIPARIASPVAVIMCELVENSIEHAFSPSSPANYIHVSFLRSPQGDEKGDYWTLTVSDNGCGIEAFESKLERSVAGLGIANQLAQQLGGSVNYSYREGALITIHIPATPAHLAS